MFVLTIYLNSLSSWRICKIGYVRVCAQGGEWQGQEHVNLTQAFSAFSMWPTQTTPNLLWLTFPQFRTQDPGSNLLICFNFSDYFCVILVLRLYWCDPGNWGYFYLMHFLCMCTYLCPCNTLTLLIFECLS